MAATGLCHVMHIPGRPGLEEAGNTCKVWGVNGMCHTPAPRPPPLSAPPEDAWMDDPSRHEPAPADSSASHTSDVVVPSQRQVEHAACGATGQHGHAPGHCSQAHERNDCAARRRVCRDLEHCSRWKAVC